MQKIALKTLAYNAIRQKIVTCEYAPGSFINEEMITSCLNLSRTPVRDALVRLEQEGLISIKPKRGILVTPLSVSDIKMIFEMRILYEPHILLHYGSSLPMPRLQEFYNIFHNQSTDNSSHFENKDYFYQLDSSFHNMIIDICPNFYIKNNYCLILTQNERFRYLTGNIADNRLYDTFREHIDIIRPCLSQNWKEASEKMICHLENSQKATFSLILESLENNHISL